MNDAKIPSYPVVHVTVQPDGSAHINVAGKHVDYSARDLEVTRAEVIAYTVTVAARLGRGVRMTTTDPDGEWKLGVYPDGQVVDLEPAPAKGRAGTKAATPRPRPTTLVVPPTSPLPSDLPTTVIERLPDRTTPRITAPPPPRSRKTPAGTPMATLKFSTGDTAIVGAAAIIGRNPAAVVADPGGAQLVLIADPSRTVSRAHADVSWIGGKLIVSDRGAGNGTALTRDGDVRVELAPGQPYELHHGDVLHVGTDVTCEISIGYVQDGAPR